MHPLFAEPPEGYEAGHGSNVDLGFGPREIGQMLATLAWLQDQALQQLTVAEEEDLPEINLRMRDMLHVALLRHEKRGPAMARKLAELECRDVLFELEKATARRDTARAALETRRSQVSAAQTRANMWLAQHGENWRGGPR